MWNVFSMYFYWTWKFHRVSLNFWTLTNVESLNISHFPQLNPLSLNTGRSHSVNLIFLSSQSRRCYIYFDLHLSRHASTHVNLPFSHLYIRKGPSASDEFLLEEHFEREMQLKKFTTRRKPTLFFFPLARHFHVGTQRERAVTRFASYWPLAVASAARDAFTHTHTPGHLVAHCTNEHTKFPHRRDKRIFAIGCSNPVGPPSTTCEAHSRKLARTKKKMPPVKRVK